MAAHLASLEIFEKAGMEKLREKSISLTNYLEFVVEKINSNNGNCLEIITPKEVNQRGCQLSIVAHGSDKILFDKLSENGVVADWREPNVIRIAPVPLYNSYEDVYRFGEILEKSL